MGDRIAGDSGTYPKDDLEARWDMQAGWRFTHKDGRDYD